MTLTGKTLEEIESEKEKEDMNKIEAIFFISGRFLTMQELVSFSDLNPITIREIIEKLQEKYEKNQSVIEIIKKGDVERERSEMWKMDIKPNYFHLLNGFATAGSGF